MVSFNFVKDLARDCHVFSGLFGDTEEEVRNKNNR
jgi:hypothetical protein